MFEVRQLLVGYKGKSVAELSNFTLLSGEHCLLLGHSGSGKTTVLSTLAGMLSPISGDILINGKVVTNVSSSVADKLGYRHVGFIFQTLHLVQALSVLDNLLLAQFASGLLQERNRAINLLEQLGIADKANDMPSTLSQGQQQRLAIARAVINNPDIILGDEPTSALDDRTCDSVIELLLDFSAKANASLIIATHDHRIKKHFPKQIVLGETT